MKRSSVAAVCATALVAGAISLVVPSGGAGADPAGVTYSVLGQPNLTANTLGSRCTSPDARFSQINHGNNDIQDGPTGIAVATTGRIFVVDDGGQRIMSWPNADALTSCQVADKIIGAGWPEGPEAIAVGPDGSLYLGDTRGQVVDIWVPDNAGNYTHDPQVLLGEAYVIGNDNNHFFYPRGVALDSSGRLFVADDYNNRVQIFSPPFTSGMAATDSIHAADDGGFSHPKAVAFSDGNLYVADFDNERVLRFPGPFNNPATTYTSDGYFEGLNNPVDLSVGPTGNLLVTGDNVVTGSPEVGVYANANNVASMTDPSSVYTFNSMVTPGPDNGAGEPLGIVQDGSGRLFWADYAGFRVVVESPGGGLTVTNTSLVAGAVYKAYTTKLTATGGTGTLVWTVAGGSLPPGIKLSSAGALSGTPTTAGSYPVTIAVHDASKPVAKSGTAGLTLLIDPMTINNRPTLTEGYVQKAYANKLVANGGKAPLYYQVIAGDLPPGVKMSTAGVFSGTPTATGTYHFTVDLLDAAAPTDESTTDFTLVVNPITIDYTPPTTPGLQGKAYSGKFTALGGKPTLVWARVSGTIPPGLTLSSAGVLSGTPSVASTFTLTVGATDKAVPANTATLTVSITIEPLSFTSTGTPDVYQYESTTIKPTVNGGKAPLTFSISAGSLPPGLKLTASSGQISGTPTTTGTYNFTLTVTDSQVSPGHATASAGITMVVHPLTITTTSLPDGTVGKAYAGKLTIRGGKTPFVVIIAGGELPPGVKMSSAGVFSGTAVQTGTFHLLLRASNKATPPDNAYRALTITINP